MSIFRTIGDKTKNIWSKMTTSDPGGYGQYTFLTSDYMSNVNLIAGEGSFLHMNSDNKFHNTGLDYRTSSQIALYENQKDDYGSDTGMYVNSKNYFENNFKLSPSVLTEISKNYKFIYDQAAQTIIDFGYDESEDTSSYNVSYSIMEMPAVPSMFNPLFGLNIVGITGNTPIVDTDISKDASVSAEYQQSKMYTFSDSGASQFRDIQDCSIKKLVQLSQEHKMGREVYKYADFMYCKNLGKYSNNRLITLRRFPLPIGDDISSVAESDDDGKPNIPGDVGRMVCWLDNTNKLDDILQYNYNETFEERQAEYQDIESREDTNERGWIGSLVNLANPNYRKQVAGGWNPGGNKLLDKFAGGIADGKFMSSDGSNYTSNKEILGRYDHNRIYTPMGIIAETNLYEGKLKFNHSFTLTFDYELRAYENINPKTAFLDLLNNILETTYRTGSFWGGQVWWIGSPQNKQGWRNAEAFVNGSFEKLDTTFSMILTGELGSIGDILGNFMNAIVQKAHQWKDDITEKTKGEDGKFSWKKLGETIDGTNKQLGITRMLAGLIKNKLGRPALYAQNSILTGDPVGPWHVTIGNPRNPILSIGNLKITEAHIKHYGPLGFDDFPSGLEVKVSLTHCRPRDMVEIGKMYTGGKTGLALPLARGKFENYVDWNQPYVKPQPGKKEDANMFATMWSWPIPPLTSGNINIDQAVADAQKDYQPRIDKVDDAVSKGDTVNSDQQ